MPLVQRGSLFSRSAVRRAAFPPDPALDRLRLTSAMWYSGNSSPVLSWGQREVNQCQSCCGSISCVPIAYPLGPSGSGDEKAHELPHHEGSGIAPVADILVCDSRVVPSLGGQGSQQPLSVSCEGPWPVHLVVPEASFWLLDMLAMHCPLGAAPTNGCRESGYKWASPLALQVGQL